MAKRVTPLDNLANFIIPKKSDFPPARPDEGARLVRAFFGIKNSAVRNAIVSLVEQMSKGFSDVA